ncbi:MAG: hypothetical protein AAFP84_03125, partial [Actinomycetota bacterium]
MTDRNDPDFDAQVRQLLADVVDAAPAPPRLETTMSPHALTNRSDGPRTRPWVIAGGIGLAAAAAVALVVALPGGDDATVELVPATEPPPAEPVPVTEPESGSEPGDEPAGDDPPA